MHPAIPVVLIAVSTAIKIAKKLQQSTPLGRADKSSRNLNLSKGADMHPVIPIVLIAVSTAIKVAKKLQQSAPLGKADKFSLDIHFYRGGIMEAEMVEAIVVIADALIDLFDQHRDLKLWQSAPLGKADKFSLDIHFNQGGSMDAEVIESIEAIIEGRIDLFDQHSC